jgi:hypothetical protein
MKKYFEIVISAEYQSYKFGTESDEIVVGDSEEAKIRLGNQIVIDTLNDIHREASRNKRLAQLLQMRNVKLDELINKYRLDPTALPVSNPFYL